MHKKIILSLALGLVLFQIFNGCTPFRPGVDDSKIHLEKVRIERLLKNNKIIQLKDKQGNSILEPKGFAFTPDNYMFLVESDQSRIHILDREMNYLRRFKINFKDGDFLSFPEDIEYSPDRTFFIVDSSNSRILKVSTNGDVERQIKSESSTGLFLNDKLEDTGNVNLKLPSGITLSPRGELYIADTYNNRIVQLNLSGDQVWSFGDTGDSVGRLSRPRDIAVDKEGLIYVTDDQSRVSVINKKKGVRKIIGTEGKGPGKFNRPKGITIWHDKYLVVCDTNNKRIQFFTLDGYLITSIDRIGGFEFEEPYSVKADDFNNLFIVDKKQSVLIKIYEL